MAWVAGMLAKYPELAVYLALGLGYWLGSVKFGKFSLGGVTGSLLAGIAIGLLFKVPVSGTAKSVVFLLFLFGIGYEVGPRFFGAMKGSGWRYAALGAFIPVVGLLTAWAVASAMGLDLGFSAGMLSGGLTESPAMGTAAEAINALAIEDAMKETLIAHIGVADALCYVGGALGVILVCSTIGPWLLRVDLRAEAAKLEAELGIRRTRAGVSSAWQPFEFRAYRIEPDSRVVGKTIGDAEVMMPGARLFIHRIRRGGEIQDARPGILLDAGDVVVVCGRREVLVETLGGRAPEVEDRELLDIPVASYEVFVSAKAVTGRTLEDLATDDAVHGVFLRQLVRYGQDIPIGLKTVVERGDVMHVVGSEAAVMRAARSLGEVVAPTEVTDFKAVGGAVFIGALLGAAASFTVGGVSVSIGTSVGTLIAGVITGYIRSVRPLFGRVPDGAVKLMQAFGLAGFVAMVGIGAGPHFVAGVREAGLRVLLGGLVVTMTPLIAGLYFGRYVLKINPLLLLGAISGAQTFTPGLAAVQEKSGSNIAVLGYSGAVPVGHILLTLWGTAIVLLMSR
jgi:putative transport protein